MKNREQLIIEAGEVIGKFLESHDKGFDLFFIDGVFYCSSACYAKQMGSFIRHFTASQATNGLTGPQWLRLGKKAAKLQKEPGQ